VLIDPGCDPSAAKNAAGTKNAAGVRFWFFIFGNMCHETCMRLNPPSYEYS
jgi:hypothetical protein